MPSSAPHFLLLLLLSTPSLLCAENVDGDDDSSGIPSYLWTIPNVYRITSSNWTSLFSHDESSSASWLFVFSADLPCDPCRLLEEGAGDVAEWAKERGIKVGIIDYVDAIDVEGRFLVLLVPTLFYVHGEKIVQYARYPMFPTHGQIKAFLLEVLEDRQQEYPKSAWLHPNRFYMAAAAGAWIAYHLLDDSGKLFMMTQEYLGLDRDSTFIAMVVCLPIIITLIVGAIVYCCRNRKARKTQPSSKSLTQKKNK